MTMREKREDPEFMAAMKKHAELDAETGTIKFNDIYASVSINVCWKGGIVSVSYAHLVWLLTHGRWPKEGLIVDHINNDAMDNRPCNHQEITEKENQIKRRGRLVYRNYGSGRYGYGLHIYNDKRDDRYYITRTLSRGHGKGDLKGIKKGLGGFDTLKLAEEKIKIYIAQIKMHGLNYIPTLILLLALVTSATAADLDAQTFMHRWNQFRYTQTQSGLVVSAPQPPNTSLRRFRGNLTRKYRPKTVPPPIPQPTPWSPSTCGNSATWPAPCGKPWLP